jgi:uncharacterized protein (TIGR02453 family)
VRHNTREWFQPRKHIYLEQVKAPMVELVTELNRAMMDFAPGYVTDAHKAIYRIYRDTRFSPDKTPYKTQIAASFARRGMEKHGAAGYYFAISHKGVDVGGGIYMPPPETLLAVRTYIAGRHAEFRQLAASSAIKRLLGAVQGEQLSRVPKGFSADHPAADLLRFKQFLLFTTLDAAIITTEAVRRVGKTLPRDDALSGVSERPARGGKAARAGGGVAVRWIQCVTEPRPVRWGRPPGLRSLPISRRRRHNHYPPATGERSSPLASWPVTG